MSKQRSGTWAIILAQGSMAEPIDGFLYIGLKRRPALKLCFTDAPTGKAGTAVLSFGSEEERQTVRRALLAPEEAPTQASAEPAGQAHSN